MKKLGFLLSILLVVSCSYVPQSTTNTTYQNKPVLEVNSSYTGMVQPQIFEAAFYNNTQIKQGSLAGKFTTINLGTIFIESGKIVSCDPLVMHGHQAFTQQFPVGRFPVQLAVLKIDKEEKVAFSRISFSDKPVAKWQVALLPNQEPVPVQADSLHCYKVDSGLGMFIDAKAQQLFNNGSYVGWEKVFNNKISNNQKGFIHNFYGHNLAAFESGYGDGCYTTYIGLDANGNVSKLITDFYLLEW